MYNFLYENDFENKAANILDRAEDIGISVGNKETNKDVIAYKVNLDNPVCPCCGCKLIIENPEDNSETDNLVSPVNEAYIDSSEVAPLVKISAEQIIDAYMETDNFDDPNKIKNLIYVTDKCILDAINTKAIELQSTLKTTYNLKVAVESLENDIREEIREILGKI